MVSREPTGSRETSRRSDRAQLVLVGAIAIGIVLIALTTVLNSAVFTENVAGGNSVDVTGDVTEFDREAVRNVRSTVFRLNHGEVYPDSGPARTTLSNHVAWNVSNYSRLVGESYADTGSVYVDVTDVSVPKTGDRIVQQNDSNFSKGSGGGNADWRPLHGDHQYGWFVVNLDVENVSQTTPLHLKVTDDAGSTLDVRINRTATNEVVVNTSVNGAHEDECTYTARNGRVLIDVLDGTAYGWEGNNECEFNSTEHLDPPFDELNIENGESNRGKYDIVVDNTSATTGVPNNCDTGAADLPCRGAVAWTVAFTTHYRTGSVAYNKSHTVEVYGG